MAPQRYKKTKILLLLLLISLLLHLVISFFFLEFGFKKRFTSFIKALSNSITNLSPEDKRIIEQKRERKNEALQKILQAAHTKKEPIKFIKPGNSRPAKLVAPKSNFGWVLFDDNYVKPKKLEIPTNKTGDVMKVKTSNATETKPQNIAPKIERNNATQTKQAPAKIKQEIKPKPLATATKVAQPSAKELKRLADTAIVDEMKKIVDQTSPVEDRIKKIRQMQESVTEYQKHPKTKEQEREGLLSSILKKDKKMASATNEQEKSTAFAWGASSLKSKQSPNIIALTKGYIEKIKGENGTDLIDRDGDPNKTPSFEEMKYISYEAKLNWCCQATWKQNSNFYNLPVAARDYQAVIGFSIDAKGNLVNSEILESSGCKEVDSAIIKNLKNTAPFPPLPKHFEKDIYTTGRVITVSINRMVF